MKPIAFLALASAALAAPGDNLAPMATPATSFVSGHESLAAVNDGFEPRNENDHSHGAYGNWPQTGTQWVELRWSKPVSASKMDVYWWKDGRGIDLPVACRLLAWDGKAFAPVKDAQGLGVEKGKYNTTTFSELKTTALRIEFDGKGKSSTGLLEWKVYDTGKSPPFPPTVEAGVDRTVIVGNARVELEGRVGANATKSQWSLVSGSKNSQIASANQPRTECAFGPQGRYVLKLTAWNGEESASDTVRVDVADLPPAKPLQTVWTTRYKIDNPLWTARTKAAIVNWIPHCIEKLSDPNLAEGGIQNFIEAGNKLAGRPAKPHFGAPWANAYLLNTVEAMCVALQVDPNGDAEIAKAQEGIKAKLEEWIPIVLAAQEPDGYLQTRFTLGTANEHGNPPPRWTIRGDHEGYIGGYLIEAGIAHYLLTEGKDRRLFDAARRLADCWDKNIGPEPKKKWFDGHEDIEQALVRLGTLVSEKEGQDAGDKYLKLADFLLDCRGGGDEYDQSHKPVGLQYEAVGHAVRAAYCYSAMAGVAMRDADCGYMDAIHSIWSNLVHKKYYITGGIGSGETSEGFGPDYSLPNNAYCESCSGCGEIFFQHKMNRMHHDALYADLVEDTLFNAVLSDLDLEGKNFTYTNSLDEGGARYKWHGCPCCVGNIPRTLLMLPEWMYARGLDGIYVNEYIGSTVKVPQVSGPEVEIVQKTDYPWSGRISLTVNPPSPQNFALFLRIPQPTVSELYTETPSVSGLVSLTLNGKPVKPEMVNGYAKITAQWKAGDRVDLEVPMKPQRVHCSDKVAANRGRVALRYGPLVYNIETADKQDVEGVLPPNAPLTAEWRPDLLGGVMVLKSTFADGKPLLAIPNYARNNRGGRSVVWIKEK